MSVNTLSLDKVVDPGIKKHFVDGYKQLPPMIEKIFKTDTQTSETDQYFNYTGLSSFAQVPQGGSYDEDEPIKAYGVNMTPVKFGKMVKVTYELRKWAKVKEIWDAGSMLGKAAARHINRSAASVINNSQNTAYTSYTDAKPLGSTQHTSASGGAAQSNASASGIILSDENLETALLALEFQLDDRGEPIQLFGNRIIVSPFNRKKALTIIKSDNKSGIADNDINVYNSMQEYYGVIECLVWYWMATSAGGLNTRWVLEDKSQSKLMWNWADKPRVDRDESVGFKQQTTYYRGFYYASKGWGDWRGLWISAGDTLAYSN